MNDLELYVKNWELIKKYCINVIKIHHNKKDFIDDVMQEGVDAWKREEPKKRVTNVFIEALYGIKTFSDGKKKFLDVLINA